MMIAAIRGHYPCVQALISNGVDINTTDKRGQTAAHMAATHGHSHTLQAILRGGADISIQDSNGWTPVHAAAYHGVSCDFSCKITAEMGNCYLKKFN